MAIRKLKTRGFGSGSPVSALVLSLKIQMRKLLKRIPQNSANGCNSKAEWDAADAAEAEDCGED